MRNEDRPRSTVQSVERAFAILRTFTPEHPVQGVSGIAEALNLNRTTVHRLLATLEACGVVRRDANSHRYTISTGVLEFANVFHQASNVQEVSQEPMTRLRDATGQTACLNLREGSTRVPVSQVESTQDLRVSYPDLGIPIPLHVGAPSRIILANLPDDEIEHYLQHGKLIAITSHTITDADRLRVELRQLREDGYALSWQERRPGVVTIAAPIFDRNGAVIGAVNISGSIQRIGSAQLRTFIPMVKEAGDEISRQLGWVGYGISAPAEG